MSLVAGVTVPSGAAAPCVPVPPSSGVADAVGEEEPSGVDGGADVAGVLLPGDGVALPRPVGEGDGVPVGTADELGVGRGDGPVGVGVGDRVGVGVGVGVAAGVAGRSVVSEEGGRTHR